MGKNPNFGFVFSSGHLVTRVRFFQFLSTFKQLGLCSVNTYGSGSSSMNLEVVSMVVICYGLTEIVSTS